MGILQLLLLLTAPGFYFFGLLDKETRRKFSYEGKWAFVIGVSVVVTSIISIAIVSFGFFWIDFIVALYAVLFIGYGFKTLMEYEFLKCFRVPYSKKAGLAVLGLLVVAFLYFQPTQYYVGGRDPGIYVNAAVEVSQSGGLMKRDYVIEEAKEKYPGVFQDQDIKYPGFYLEEREGKTYTNPQFYHTYSMWLAIGRVLLGPDKFLYITPLLALLSLLIFYSCVADLFNRRVGLISVVLLGINLSQVWYARGPYTEILSQLVLWFSIFILLKAGKTKDRIVSFLGGLSLGTAILIRLDNIFILAPLAIYFAVLFVKDNQAFKEWLIHYLIALSSTGLLFLAYVYKYGREYTRFQLIQDNFVPDSFTLTGLFLLMAAAGLFMVLVVWLGRKFFYRVIGVLETNKGVTLKIFSLFAIFAFIYLYFFRPHIPNPQMLDMGIRTYSEETLVRLGWYVSDVGLWLSLAGFIYFLNKGFRKQHLFFILVMLLNFTLFLYDPKIYPEHFWAVRRHVPFIIPTLIIFIAYGTNVFYNIRRRFKWAMIPMIVLVLYLVGYSAYTLFPFMYHTEYGGAKEGLGRLAERFDENDIIIADDVDFISRLIGTPLEFIYSKTVMPLREEYDEENLAKFVSDKVESGHDVYLFVSSKVEDMENPKIYYKFIDDVKLLVRAAEITYNCLPGKVIQRNWEFNMYKCIADDIHPGKRILDVGTPNEINFKINGFYWAEGDENINYRWSGPTAEVSAFLPQSYLREPGKKQIVMRARHFLPEDIPHEDVEVYINDGHAATIGMGPEFEEYVIQVPDDISTSRDRIVIRFETKTWSPAGLGISKDERELGFMLDWIQLR